MLLGIIDVSVVYSIRYQVMWYNYFDGVGWIKLNNMMNKVRFNFIKFCY